MCISMRPLPIRYTHRMSAKAPRRLVIRPVAENDAAENDAARPPPRTPTSSSPSPLEDQKLRRDALRAACESSMNHTISRLRHLAQQGEALDQEPTNLSPSSTPTIPARISVASSYSSSRATDNMMRARKDRLRGLIRDMQAGLVERDVEVRLLVLAALCGEHVLYIGPPGTAKSELGRRLARCTRASATAATAAAAGAFPPGETGRFFERLLTRFSVPEELFGPLSMKALEEDMYLRQTEGFLPTAQVAFIDEIFKANSAILNTLLTILNER